jgi:transposase InsO family protein
MGIGRLCNLFGKSRQAYYDRNYFNEEKRKDEIVALELVVGIRRELPGLGGHKLHWLMRQPLKTHGIKLGRDKLFKLLRQHNLLIKKRKIVPKTTDSMHWLKKYPNLFKEFVISQSEEVWVSDITYICVGNDFNYLFLITDAHSHKIVGYCLHSLLTKEGALLALDMALKTRTKFLAGMIHHSDRGIQYCSFDYVRNLKDNGIEISMTENGDPYENAMAERINGILKNEFGLHKLFKTHYEATLAIQSSINAYNQYRPHMSCNNMTPDQAHETELELIKLWKPRKPRTRSPTEIKELKE